MRLVVPRSRRQTVSEVLFRTVELGAKICSWSNLGGLDGGESAEAVDGTPSRYRSQAMERSRGHSRLAATRQAPP